MRIRRATFDDINSIVEITRNDGYERPLDPDQVRKYMDQGDMYFLLLNPKPTGVAKLAINNKSKAEMFVISIRLEFQKKGLGSKLIKFVETVTRKIGKNKLCVHVREENTNAIDFYYKNGFQKIGQVKDLYEKGDRHLTLVKILK